VTVTNDDRFAVPVNLPRLVARYADKSQSPVRFRLPSWNSALDGVPGDPTRLLANPQITSESTTARFREVGDRVVTRDAVAKACSSIDFTNNESVVAAFVLVMAWGSGTSNSRSLRNTKTALGDVAAAATVLRDSATALRPIQRIDDVALADAHRKFSLPGIREAFFTKWFAFAGITAERAWQPLILDSRVRATLHNTLNVWLNQLTAKRRDPERYVAYVAALHSWSTALPEPTTAARLEWILFTHNGSPV
jgi:hypothetical protein